MHYEIRKGELWAVKDDDPVAVWVGGLENACEQLNRLTGKYREQYGDYVLLADYHTEKDKAAAAEQAVRSMWLICNEAGKYDTPIRLANMIRGTLRRWGHDYGLKMPGDEAV